MPRRIWDWPRNGRGPGLAGLVLLAAFLLVGFDSINSLAAMRTQSALAHGRSVLDLEHHLHISVEARASSWLVRHTALARVANWTYNLCQIVVTTAVLVGLWIWRPRSYARLRWPILGANLVALAVFWLYPVAPPRLIAGRGIVDVIGVVSVPFGWKPGILPDTPDQFQALPSLHAAWATWVGAALVLTATRRAVKILGVGYPLLIGVVVVVTGTHSVVDVVTGAALMLLLLALMMGWRTWSSASSPSHSRARPMTSSSPPRRRARRPASARSSVPTTS